MFYYWVHTFRLFGDGSEDAEYGGEIITRSQLKFYQRQPGLCDGLICHMHSSHGFYVRLIPSQSSSKPIPGVGGSDINRKVRALGVGNALHGGPLPGAHIWVGAEGTSHWSPLPISKLRAPRSASTSQTTQEQHLRPPQELPAVVWPPLSFPARTPNPF